MFEERRKKRIRNKRPRRPWTEEWRAEHRERVKRCQDDSRTRLKGRLVLKIADRMGEDWTETLYALLDSECHKGGSYAEEWLKQRIKERRQENAEQREGCRLYQNGECRREDCWRLLREHKTAA